MDNPHVHFSVGLDATNPGQMQAAAVFFNKLAELADSEAQTLAKVAEVDYQAAEEKARKQPAQAPSEKPAKKTRNRRSKAEIAADKKGKAAGAPPRMDGESDEDGADLPTYTRSDVRAALSVKIDDHRPVIQKKMKALGATNISTLKEADYPAFMDFLNGLK